MFTATIFFAGIIVGALALSGILFPQIQNRYIIGMNNGYITGSSKCINFMQAHLESEEIPDSFSIKATAVHPVQIDGVKTFEIQD